MSGIPSLPPGYALDSPPQSAAAAPALPPGYALDQGTPKEPSGNATVANALTGLQGGAGNLLGAPQAIGSLLSGGGEQKGLIPGPAELAAKFWPSANTWNRWGYELSGLANRLVGAPPPQPYQPQTAGEKIAQSALGAVVPSLVGGGGLGAAASRVASGVGAGGAASAYGEAQPNDYWGQLAAGLAGALVGGGAGASLSGAGQVLARHFSPASIAGPRVASDIVGAAGVPVSDITAAIDKNLPQWTALTPGAQPTLGNVTENAGIRNMEYADQAAAARTGDTTYQANARAMNAAQRQAIGGITPDTAQTMRNLAADRDAAVANIPPGISAQQAGAQFRQNLQAAYDQRAATRAAGGSAFDALQNSPAQINLRPIMDYATSQAAQNAGEVGQAYQRALAQFRSATGITLDTAPFANSVLKGLGDTASSYPAGSAAARAVLDVKGRLENQLSSEVPEIGAARAAWAQNSRPLDVFETKPFAQVLATDRFGRSYAMPNDAVASAFLRGNGSADSLDALNRIFDDPAAATRGLQDYLAGQVRQNAVRPDGSIDTGALQRTMQPYQRALLRFPQLAQQFKSAGGAQDALDQQGAYQKLYDLFHNGLGTMEQDAAGNPMYSPAQFDRAVQQAGPLIDQAYGPQGAAVINRVNDQLSNIAQTAYAKVKGQSGTPQVLLGHGGGNGWLGSLVGSIGGAALEHLFEGGGFGGAYVGAKAGEAMHAIFGNDNAALASTIDHMRRQALTDPAYAKALLQKYNPSLPTTGMRRALTYVMRRSPGAAGGLVPSAGAAVGGPQPAYAQ